VSGPAIFEPAGLTRQFLRGIPCAVYAEFRLTLIGAKAVMAKEIQKKKKNTDEIERRRLQLTHSIAFGPMVPGGALLGMFPLFPACTKSCSATT